MAAFLQPLHILPWVSWHSEILVFVGVTFMAWTAIVRTSSDQIGSSLIFPMATIPLFGMGILVFLQWLGGLLHLGGDALVYGAYVLLCVVSMALGFTGIPGVNAPMTGIARLIVVCASGSAFIGIAQALEVSDPYSWINQTSSRRPGANLGQPNHLSTLLLMGLASAVYLYEQCRLKLVTAILIILILIVALASTESRAGVVGFVALALWWFGKQKTIRTRLKHQAVLVATLLFLCLWWSWPTLMAEYFQSEGVSAMQRAGSHSRLTVWPQLLQAVFLRPWLGWGFGQTASAHNVVADNYSVSEPFTYAHNIILDSAIGFGLPITILLLCLIGVWLLRRVLEIKDSTSWYCLGLVIPVAVHSFFEFPFAYAYFLMPVAFAIGTLERTLGKQTAFTVGPKLMFIALAFSTSMLVLSISEYVNIEEDFRVLRFEDLKTGHTPSNYKRPDILVLTQLDVLLQAGRIKPQPHMLEQDIETVRVAAMRYPWTAIQNRYALTLALNGQPTEARRQLHVMKTLHGETSYKSIKQYWHSLAGDKYPQLNEIEIP